MKRCLLIFFMCATALLAAEKVKIGVNIGFTGLGAGGNAPQLQAAMMMAADELNARPKKPYTYELIFEDNGYTPKGAVLAARKMLAADKVDVLVSVFDFVVAPVAPIARQEKVANFGALSWGAKFADNEYTWNFGYSEVSAAHAMHRALSKENMPTAIVAVRQASVENYIDAAQRLMKQDSREKYQVFLFNPGEIEFRSIILKLRENKIQRVVLLAFGSDMEKFLYQLRMQPDYKPKLFGFAFGLRYAQNREQVVGSIIVGGPAMSEAFKQEFARYQRKDAPIEDADGAYDSIKFLASALEELPISQQPIRERILQALRQKKDFQGIAGHYTKENGVFDAPCLLYRLTANGEEPYTP